MISTARANYSPAIGYVAHIRLFTKLHCVHFVGCNREINFHVWVQVGGGSERVRVVMITKPDSSDVAWYSWAIMSFEPYILSSTLKESSGSNFENYYVSVCIVFQASYCLGY